MLQLPSPTTSRDPAYEPVVRLCETILLTPAEVARHYRYSLDHLANMRGRRKGPPWVKLAGGIRYRQSELLAWEIHGQHGGWTFQRVSLALATMPGMTADARRKIENHLKSVLEPA